MYHHTQQRLFKLYEPQFPFLKSGSDVSFSQEEEAARPVCRTHPIAMQLLTTIVNSVSFSFLIWNVVSEHTDSIGKTKACTSFGLFYLLLKNEA
jgi:hypothetical protein